MINTESPKQGPGLKIPAELSIEDRFFRSLADASPNGIFRADADGHITFASRRLLDWFNISESQIDDPNAWLDRLHPDDRRAARTVWRQVIRDNSGWSHECRLVSKDGAIRWLKFLRFPHYSDDGLLLGLVGTVEDITERKHQERILSESEKLYHSLIDAIPQIVFMNDENGHGLYVNRKWHEYTGFALHDRSFWIAAMHLDEAESNVERWRSAVAAGEPYETEFRLRRADGAYRWHLVRAIPVQNQEGRIWRWIGTATDIEDQKQLAATVRQSEERLSLAVNGSGLGLWDMDLRTGIDVWSEGLYRILGTAPAKISQPRMDLWCSLVHPDDLARVAEEIERARRERSLFSPELRLIRPRGWNSCLGIGLWQVSI
jgi:PAS domain S-box-containing protein